MEKLGHVFGLHSLQIRGYRSGLIPVGGRLRQSAGRPILLIGDAAGWVSPLTGGGIHSALEWGRRAGIAIADHLLDGGPDPVRAVSRRLPSFAFKRALRRLFDLPVPNRLIDGALHLRSVRQLARLVFFHHRGFLSRAAWQEWLQHARSA
jgi:flavin-dependent dehydrogenase